MYTYIYIYIYIYIHIHVAGGSSEFKSRRTSAARDARRETRARAPAAVQTAVATSHTEGSELGPLTGRRTSFWIHAGHAHAEARSASLSRISLPSRSGGASCAQRACQRPSCQVPRMGVHPGRARQGGHRPGQGLLGRAGPPASAGPEVGLGRGLG